MGVEGRVLLIEDRPDWRRKLTKYLKADGHSFKTAKTYTEALSLLDTEAFDVVLVDLRLVDWDDSNFQGLDLLPRIDELRKTNGTQAVVVTAYPTPENIRQSFRDHGVSDFLFKADFDPKMFKRAVRTAIIRAYAERYDILD